METEERPVDRLLKWYTKQRELGNIPEPTEADRVRAHELAEKLLKWYDREKSKPQVILEKEPVIELGRLCFKGGSMTVYLPKSICRALNLDRKVHTSLVIVADGSDSILLVKDTKLAEKLRPMVLEMREKMQKIKAFQAP
jgi:hypothetical protein